MSPTSWRSAGAGDFQDCAALAQLRRCATACFVLLAMIPAPSRGAGITDDPRSETREKARSHPKLPIPVTAATEHEGRSYRILGRVYTLKMGLTTFSRPNEESLLPRLVAPAKALGADAILGVHSGTLGILDGGERYRWVSGMAVRFEAGGDSASGPLLDEAIAVAPCAISDSLIGNPEKRARANGWLQLGATYYLEGRGYFTRTCSTGVAPSGAEELNAMDEEAWQQRFGPWIGKVLLTRLVAKDSGSIGVMSGNSARLDAELYSRSDRRVVWHGSSKGASIQLDPLSAMLGSGYRNSLQSAMQKLIQQIPEATGASR